MEQFIVMRDGEIDTELSVLPPSGIERVALKIREGVSRFGGHVAMQTRMAVFDTLHGTNYRTIRNELVEQKRRQEFEHSIGLVAIDNTEQQ